MRGIDSGASESFLQWLSHIRLSRVLAPVLLVLVIVPLVTHYYLSKTIGDTPMRHSSRIKLELPDDLETAETADLKLRIEEMFKIKDSVSGELMDLESRRQKLNAEIADLNKELTSVKQDLARQHSELERMKLSLQQAEVSRRELEERSMPELLAPLPLSPPPDSHQSLAPPSPHTVCSMQRCFDHSRCSISTNFPVFVYSSVTSDEGVLQALQYNHHLSSDPASACVFVATLDSGSDSEPPSELPYWKGDGRNHVVINTQKTSAEVELGRAMLFQTHYYEHQFRRDFDLVSPPLMPLTIDFWQEIEPVSPARRKYFLTFQGELKADEHMKWNKVDSSNFNGEMSENVAKEYFIVEHLKSLQFRQSTNKFFFQFSCPGGVMAGTTYEWQLCETSKARLNLLKESTFSLILAPSNDSLLSTYQLQLRLQESLKMGAIPVILGEQILLPFAEFIDWRKAALVLPKARVTELHFFLRSINDVDVLSLRRQGRLIYSTYTSSVQPVVNTLLAVIRSRIGLAPAEQTDEPSPSFYRDGMEPLQMNAVISEPDIDENLGPIEQPFPSPKFQRNYTLSRVMGYELWNQVMSPFLLYPSTPFESAIPSEAKFIGSSVGFRPIGAGAGGAGKEFSANLGGNTPKEQFTIIMLTYEREQVLVNSLSRLYGLPYLNKVIVVWNSMQPPSEALRWPDIGVPIHVIKTAYNSLNNRFLPYDVIETDAVLSMDDDAHLRHDEIIFGFRVWREAKDRLVGFPGRYHAWDLNHGGWLYNSNYSCELSMVLTGAAFVHRYYLYQYSYVMPQAIREMVDEYMNCEDIAMNFLVSHITRKPPLKVTSRWTFRCSGCPITLSEDDTHFNERHKCINFFVKIYGYMPLLNTQFRADSVLFKTRIPHDKQKCFKFI